MVEFIHHSEDDNQNNSAGNKPLRREVRIPSGRTKDNHEERNRRPPRRKPTSDPAPQKSAPARPPEPAQSHPSPKTPQPPAAARADADTSTPPKKKSRRRRGRRRKNKAETNSPPNSGERQKPMQQEQAQREPAAQEPAVPKKPADAAWDPASFQVQPLEGKTRFQDLGIAEELLHAIADLGWEYCTPIQAGILPAALKGTDCTGRAQTGTGKTAAFLLAAMDRLLKTKAEDPKKHFPRMLVLAPTRELVKQIEKDAFALAKYTPINVISIYGGSSYNKQRDELAKKHPEIVIATPGRLIDLMQQRTLHLNHCEILVIDEADRMLDMGFIPDVRSIVRRTPPRAQRHTLLFSATLTADVVRLASQWLKEPEVIEIEPEQVVTDTVDQRVFIVENENKFALLLNLIFSENLDQIIIFANRRNTVDELNRQLKRYDINCAMISGALSQSKRERTLEDFKKRKIQVLIATDVAGRGLHVEGISHVINYNLPTDPEDYVHRIGRTGRAGATGTSISFACEDESFYIPDIEEYLGASLPCVHPEGELLNPPPAPTHAAEKRPPRDNRRGPPRGRSNNRNKRSNRR
jgi:ATP-dependent RNA helicase RhlB